MLGTKGSARYSYNDFVDNSKHMVHSHSYQAYPYTIYAQAEHFIDQCVRNRRPPLSSLQDAATSLRVTLVEVGADASYDLLGSETPAPPAAAAGPRRTQRTGGPHCCDRPHSSARAAAASAAARDVYSTKAQRFAANSRTARTSPYE